MKFSTLIVLIFLIYFIIVVFMYLNQRKLLYLPSENNYLDDQIEFSYEEIFIDVEKNLKLKAWFIENDLKRYKTLVFFHGNAGNLSNRVYKLNKLSKLNLNVLIIAWRGFSGNDGEPSEKNLYNDAKMAINWLNLVGVENKNIVLYGESLGTGVAVELGQNNRFDSIILESPFTSMEKAAKNFYPWLPIKFLLKDKYDTENKIENIKLPILIMHGKKDKIVPFKMGKKLFELANEPKSSYFTNEDDHMLEFNTKLIENIKSFLRIDS